MLQNLEQKLIDLGLPKEFSVQLIKETAINYSGPNRYYHNLTHIASMYGLLSPLEKNLANPLSTYLALVFHDWVYDSTQKDNEEKSAELAVEYLSRVTKLGSTLEYIKQLILCTKNHLPIDLDSSLFLDADLGILGAAPNQYQTYSKQVRQEYAWVLDEDYRIGRLSVLTNFLQRTSIFHSPVFRNKFEKQARINLQAEINELQKRHF